MPGMMELILRKSMMNTLQADNLWLDSPEILALRYGTIGWLERGNPTYTYFKDIETKIETAMAKATKRNPTAVKQKNS